MQTFKLLEGGQKGLNSDEICFLTNFVKYGPKEEKEKALHLLNTNSQILTSLRQTAYNLFDEAAKSF